MGIFLHILILPSKIKIYDTLPLNANGKIDYEEFIRMCIPKEKLFTEENLKNAFSMFDTESKGFITPQKIITTEK
jgi:calcium-dependent protein kinase